MDTKKHLIEKYRSVPPEALPSLPVSALTAYSQMDPELFTSLFGIETIGDLANHEIILIAHQLVNGNELDHEGLGRFADRLPEELFSVPQPELRYLPISIFSKILDTNAIEEQLGVTTIGQLAELLAPVHQLFEAARQLGEDEGADQEAEPEGGPNARTAAFMNERLMTAESTTSQEDPAEFVRHHQEQLAEYRRRLRQQQEESDEQ